MTRPTPPVTPTGVRDGDPDSLAGLAQRRSGSVFDYARHACGPTVAMDVTAEAFARFRGAVVAADDPHDLAPDPLLLSCTRNAAAAFAPVADGPACADTPFLLVGRYEGTASAAEAARLTSHLASCPVCTRYANAVEQAERAFRAPHPAAPGGVVVARVIAALRAAAPIRGESLEAVVGAEPPPVTPVPPAPVAAVTERDENADGAAPAPHEAAPREVPVPAATVADQGRPDALRRVVVPSVIVAAGAITAMAVSGLFGGTSAEPARGTPGLPAPTPPARPPAADTEIQRRAAEAARDALERVRARERETARRAAQERAAGGAPAASDPAAESESAPTPSSSAPGSPSSSTQSGAGSGSGSRPGAGSGTDTGAATIEPDEGSGAVPDTATPMFEPQSAETPG